MGLGVAMAINGDPYKATQVAAGTPAADAETNIELTYRAPVTSWLTLQPDLQYVVDPGTSSTLDDAFVAGLRFEIAFEF